MNKRILMLKGASRYNVLRKAADCVAVGFRNKGYEVDVIDIVYEKDGSYVMKMLKQEYAFVFSIQALLFENELADDYPLVLYIKNLWFGWIVDDLYYHSTRVRNAIYCNTYLFTVDDAMKRVAVKMYPNVSHINTLYHGGFETESNNTSKEIDVLFPGTIGERPIWEQYANEPAPSVTETLIGAESLELLRNNPELSVRNAIEKILNKYGEEMTTELLTKLNRVIHYVDSVFRYECKYEMLDTLLQAGLSVHLVGEGHDDLLEKYSNLIINHGASDIEDVIDLMSKSKIVINPCPAVFEKGFHERIFTAMLCNAAIFTPYTKFAEESIGEYLELVDMKNLASMVDKIKSIICNFDEYKVLKLDKSYEYAAKNHTWKKRGEQIVEFFENGCQMNMEPL